MPELNISADWSYRGLNTVILENRFLRVVVLPQLGGKIWQITYKPLDTNLLWNNPRIAPARIPMNARYDDVWCGGWDELFPNDEVACIEGENYPDHGEAWTADWKAEPFEKPGAVGVVLSARTPISSMYLEKTITLCTNEARLHFHHKFTNEGGASFPFLWKLHPAFAVSPQHRIDFPPMKVVLDPAFAGTLGGAISPFDWPYAQVDGKKVDVRRIPEITDKQVYFFYGTEMKEGWCALTNVETGLACGLSFDPEVFGSCWLFASYGGWRNYNVAVLEPCTGYPLNFETMQKAGRAHTLAPGSSMETEVLFTVQPNTQSVGKIQADGTMTAAST
jgi:hypothetical protein